MSAYFLFDLLEVTDEAKMNEYREKVGPNVEQFGGTFRVVGGEQQPLEGKLSLNFPVLIEFPSREKALHWYNSPEYTQLRTMRFAAAKVNGVLIDGDVLASI